MGLPTPAPQPLIPARPPARPGKGRSTGVPLAMPVLPPSSLPGGAAQDQEQLGSRGGWEEQFSLPRVLTPTFCEEAGRREPDLDAFVDGPVGPCSLTNAREREGKHVCRRDCEHTEVAGDGDMEKRFQILPLSLATQVLSAPTWQGSGKVTITQVSLPFSCCCARPATPAT